MEPKDNKNKKEVTNEKSLAKKVDNYMTDIDELSKEFLGYGNVIRNIIDPEINRVNFDRYGVNKAKSIQNNILNMRGADKTSRYKMSERILASIEGKQIENTELTNILKQRVEAIVEMNYLVNQMPELEDALDRLGDDVAFPNVSTKSGVLIEFTGNDKDSDLEKDEQLMKYLVPDDPLDIMHNRRMYSYNIQQDVKDIVRDFGINGYRAVATIPYKNIAQELLFDKSSRDVTGVSSTGEALSILEESKKKVMQPYGEALLMDQFPDIFGKEIQREVRHLFCNTPYSEEDIEYVADLIKKGGDNLFKVSYNPELTRTNFDIGEALSPASEAVVGSTASADGNNDNYSNSNLNMSQLGALKKLKERQNKKFIIDNLLGCTRDVLNPSRCIPVYLKEEILGMYVIENDTYYEEKAQITGNLHNLLGTNDITDTFNIQATSYNQRIKDILFADIKKVLEGNLNKNMLKHNPGLVEDISHIIQNDPSLLAPKVRFIPRDFLTIHKFGPGTLGTPLLLKVSTYAHMYIQLMKSDIMDRVILSKPRTKIKVPFGGSTDTEETVARAIDELRNAIPNLLSIGIPDIMNDTSSSYQTVFVPVTQDEKQPFDIEQMPQFTPENNMDYLKYLLNKCTLALGYPADILDPSTSLDFASKLANINYNHLIRILSLQKAISVSLTEFATKYIRLITGNDKIEVKVTFESPNDLNDKYSKDILDYINRLSDAYFAFVDKDTKIPKEFKEVVKQEINRRLMVNILDFEMYDNIIRQAVTYQIGTREID